MLLHYVTDLLVLSLTAGVTMPSLNCYDIVQLPHPASVRCRHAGVLRTARTPADRLRIPATMYDVSVDQRVLMIDADRA